MRTLAALAIALAGCSSPTSPGDEDASSPVDASGSADLTAGGCSPKCSDPSPFCNATGHCVACLKDGDCAAGSFCKIVSDAIATCTPGCTTDDRCPNGQKCCDMRCVDTATDVKNCGACNMPCLAVHAAASCAAGQCASGKCDVGWGDCNKNAADGCEANLRADPANCTGCGMACAIPNAFTGCADGCYATACKFGFDDCNLNAMDGCETSVLSDKNNCGGCGKPCLNLPNASSTCTNGACLLDKCNQGFANCDGMAANGCEVNTGTNISNCGACGNICPMGNICVGGGCTCPMCNIPNASAKCINNMCVFDKCNPGFSDCDNNTGNGCEVNTDNDAKNCGACGTVCPMNTPNCVAGVCSLGFNCMGWTPLQIGNVTFCYSNMAGTCQTAHQFCEALGGGYRLFCGDDWQPGKSGEGCGNATAFTAYDIVNKYFPGKTAAGGYSQGQFNCVYGGANNQCVGDAGGSPATNINGYYAFCAPKNYYKNPPDGLAFAQVCGN